MAFRIGQCYYKDKKYAEAGKAFDDFAKVFPDDALAADAVFWSGESFRMASNNREAFQRYNRCAAGSSPRAKPRSTPAAAWPCPRCSPSSKPKRRRR